MRNRRFLRKRVPLPLPNAQASADNEPPRATSSTEMQPPTPPPRRSGQTRSKPSRLIDELNY